MKLQNTGMKFSLMFLGCLLWHISLQAQYYYSDILGGKDIQTQISTLIQYKVNKVSVTAFDAGNEEIEDFILYQQINRDKKTLTTYSKSNLSDASILETGYNEQHLPIYVLDSSEGASTRTSYQYDAMGRVKVLESVSIQSEQQENVVSEKRIYTYNTNGVPETMLRIKGNRDTMQVNFIATDNGLPGEEQWIRAGKKVETWYYYYDEQNRLTDIVRFSAAAKKMLPDYLFGYDETGNISSRISVQPDTGDFRIWLYSYDSRGLKKEGIVKNRSRQPEGKMVYTYQ
jgi:hypothetical protein